jgi:hypothetical protein
VELALAREEQVTAALQELQLQYQQVRGGAWRWGWGCCRRCVRGRRRVGAA